MTGFLESAQFLDVPSVDLKYNGLTLSLHNGVMSPAWVCPRVLSTEGTKVYYIHCPAKVVLQAISDITSTFCKYVLNALTAL